MAPQLLVSPLSPALENFINGFSVCSGEQKETSRDIRRKEGEEMCEQQRVLSPDAAAEQGRRISNVYQSECLQAGQEKIRIHQAVPAAELFHVMPGPHEVDVGMVGYQGDCCVDREAEEVTFTVHSTGSGLACFWLSRSMVLMNRHPQVGSARLMAWSRSSSKKYLSTPQMATFVTSGCGCVKAANGVNDWVWVLDTSVIRIPHLLSFYSVFCLS
ncbi:hypothetical protein WMY93_020874 [Mugilogobius chulae]|uniref:Uncharacterized protein n=1 Tax=Mugilogobius chulae TaxID=88201 RepID=A0AAW0NJ45_9GOBI